MKNMLKIAFLYYAVNPVHASLRSWQWLKTLKTPPPVLQDDGDVCIHSEYCYAFSGNGSSMERSARKFPVRAVYI